jgi:amino acid permease
MLNAHPNHPDARRPNSHTRSRAHAGLTNPTATGSLRHPALTRPWPQDWSRLPLTFGLIMAGFSGHSVFPSIYRDMRSPRAYPGMVVSSYSFTLTFYLLFACIGYAMFGDAVMPEITQNLSRIPSFAWLAQGTLVMVILSPLTKYPLATFPICLFVGRCGGRLCVCVCVCVCVFVCAWLGVLLCSCLL